MRSLRNASVVLVALLAATAPALPSVTAPGQSPAHHANELTLAGLRPGRDTLARAIRLYKKPNTKQSDGVRLWLDACRADGLFVDAATDGRISSIRLSRMRKSQPSCATPARAKWRTGLNLAIGDSASRALQVYGKPDSRSPSTRDGQPLELLYYAFDWAGPDVSQVMEVVCTAGKDGKPGQVVEITLAAPSL